MSATRTNTKLADKVEESLGERFCFTCQHYAKTDGGVFVRDARGKSRWRCGPCRAKCKSPTKP